MQKSLQQRIEEYPALFEEALAEKLRCEREVEELELEVDGDELDDLNDRNMPYEHKRKLAKLETDIAKLQIRIYEAQGKAEINHRAETSKATESSSKAAVRSDASVVELELKMKDLEEQRSMLKIDELEKAAEIRASIDKPSDNASAKLSAAKAASMKASARFDAVQVTLESYRLLVELADREDQQ
jgi:hypothetical protein